MLLPAGAAFDAIASSFDAAFDPWLSVAAQRAAVRAEFLAAFTDGAKLLEVGGGTGKDAAWLVERGRQVFLTDASPAMVREAERKIGESRAESIPAEDLGILAERGMQFDGAYSNFAALNCVGDLAPVGRALARVVRPGGKAVLVLFGCCCPAEIFTEALRGRWGNCFRRFRRGAVPASLRGWRFTVRYHRGADIARAMAPDFRLVDRKAVGLLVPPSAAEPWISRHPKLLARLEAADRRLARSLAPLGDHVLYVFERRGGR
ncbi:MAG TPA: class I SAM-dependent methyltransferase [Croceibacterium sp.]|nr:class I SAM-dependent methyltransferase [Croceibacterium sp.]